MVSIRRCHCSFGRSIFNACYFSSFPKCSQALGDVNKIRQRAGLSLLKSVTEEDIEKERIKELGFENGDRLLYLVAMQKIIDGQKRNPGAVYENPNTDGDPIPAMNPPYSNMYVPLPSIEYLYSGSYQQP